MVIPSHNEIEAWILKLTFTSVLVGSTIIFIVKLGYLFVYAFQVKSTELLIYLQSGEMVSDLGKLVWQIMKEAAKGGVTP